ncbi:L-rhamnose mutarotase [Blautia sp. OF03-15BH]|nr:L-rhamnose mutarotase [Blautia sp. OF03-15BH]RGX98238.1 L-rhamnose mutarotase [Blautia sp. OF03-15BH]
MKDRKQNTKNAIISSDRKWWDFMADIMETNPDNSPVSIDLQTVFHLD